MPNTHAETIIIWEYMCLTLELPDQSPQVPAVLPGPEQAMPACFVRHMYIYNALYIYK